MLAIQRSNPDKARVGSSNRNDENSCVGLTYIRREIGWLLYCRKSSIFMKVIIGSNAYASTCEYVFGISTGT